MTSEGVAVGTQHLVGFQPHFRGVSAITAPRQDLEWPSCLLGQENRPQLSYQEGASDSHWAPGSRTRNPLLGRRGPRTGSKAATSCWKPAGVRPGASPWTQRPKDEAPPGPTAASLGNRKAGRLGVCPEGGIGGGRGRVDKCKSPSHASIHQGGVA